MGTTAAADEMPLVTAAFQSGAISQESVGGQQDSQEDGGLNVEAVPVRYDSQVVAVLTHQAALAARRKASPLEAAYLDCAGDLLHMLSEGTFPNVGDLAMSRSSPRVGDGFIRLDVAGARLQEVLLGADDPAGDLEALVRLIVALARNY